MATPPKKPAARRATRRKVADKATGAAGAAKAATTRKPSTERATEGTGTTGTTAAAATAPKRRAPARKTATTKAASSRSGQTKAGQTKAAVKSAPHNVATKAEAAVKRVREKAGLKTAIAAGIGAVGAVATAALLTLRGSRPKREPERLPAPDNVHAEQADGTDSTASFNAGIADEGTIPKA